MRDRLLPCLVAAGALVPAPAPAQQAYEPPPERLPREVAEQPVPFDHKLHTGRGMACSDCHPGAADSPRAGLPGRDACMLCHQAIAADRPAIRRLAAMPAGSTPPWERVYRVPDYVFFSHAEHSAARVACGDCHGPVGERRVLAQELSTNMVACLNCHVRSKASTECYLCHDLGQ